MPTPAAQRITKPTMRLNRIRVSGDRTELRAQHLDVRVNRAVENGPPIATTFA
jgi:hypothetical protein